MERPAEQVVGVLSGFDRMLFRGAIRSLANAEGATVFLCQAVIKFTEFGEYVNRLSTRVKGGLVGVGAAAGVNRLHLTSPKVSKDELSRAAWQRDPARTGLIAITRQLSLLRAHGFLHNVPQTHRDIVPPAAHNVTTTLLAARNANPHDSWFLAEPPHRIRS